MPINFRETFPLTYDHAVKILIESADQEEANYLKRVRISELHHGLGTDLRNGWGLWHDTFPLTKHMRERFGLCHADDLSTILLEAMLAHFRGIKFDPQSCADHYKLYWENQGIDPKTMKQIK